MSHFDSIRIQDHFVTFTENGIVRFQFHGKMDIDTMLWFFARHFMTEKKGLGGFGKTLPIIVGKNNARRWVINRSRFSDGDLARVFPDEKERAELWVAGMTLGADEVRIYDSAQQDAKRRKLPLLILRMHRSRSSVATCLDATEEQMGSMIEEIVSSHILGHQPRLEVANYIAARISARYFANIKKDQPEPEKQEGPLTPGEELKRMIWREKMMAVGGHW